MNGRRKRILWLAWMIFPVAISGAGERLSLSEAASPPLEACRGGYRQSGVLRDFTLGRRWMIFVNCAHPEMPRIASLDAVSGEVSKSEAGPDKPRMALAVSGEIPPPPAAIGSPAGLAAPAAAPRLVAAASRVRLWRRDSVAAIDLAGTALDSGAEGAEIRVRVTAGGQLLRGIVRGPASVELSLRRAVGFTGASQ
jgi:hypothetical protein